MKKTNVQTVTKHIIAIVLCTVLSVVYFPMSGISDGKAYGAVSWIDQVKSIQFVSIDPSNYEFYDGADNMPVDDEDYDPNEDDYFFYNGDRIIATLIDNSTITITYYEDEEGENCWWEDEEGNKLAQSQEPVILRNPRLKNITTPQTFYITIKFAEKTTTQTAKMLASPVREVSFTPRGTEEEKAERFTMVQGDDEFEVNFEIGDMLTVTTTSGSKMEYVANEMPVEDEEDTYYIDFFDANGAEIPYEYGHIDWESFDSSLWNLGPHTIYVTCGKKKAPVTVNVVANEYSAMTYVPKKKTYTQVELILNEFYNDEDGNYYCCPDISEGDKLTLTKKETGVATTYTFDGTDFKDSAGNILEDGWAGLDLYHKGTESSANAGSGYKFTAEYAFLKYEFSITVIESNPEDKTAAEELRDARDTATDRIEEIFESKNPEDYREAQWDQLYNAYSDAMDAAENASTPAEARNIAATFESTLNQIKTDAQMRADEEAARRAASAAVAPAAAPAEIQDLPAVKISKPKAAKKKVTVNWKKINKKNLKKIQGIEIRVAGPGVDKIVTAGKKKTSKKVGGLQSKQKYTVQVRAYAWIGGVKHVSAWKSKSVKVK